MDDIITLHRLLGLKKELFIPPDDVSMSSMGVDTLSDGFDMLFRRALENTDITSEAIQFLNSVKYRYSEDVLEKCDRISLTAAQTEDIFKYDEFARAFQKVALKSLGQNRSINIYLTADSETTISKVMYEDFEFAEAPKSVARYLAAQSGKCVLLDIGKNNFLPCGNALVLSKRSPESSFSILCSAVDPDNNLSVRIKLQNASKKLDQYVEDGSESPQDFLRKLRSIRQFVMDALGRNGYKNYINLLLKSGTDPGRFVQELLQNADDCEYPLGVVPEFSFSIKDGSVVTEYNEFGFTKANIRAIIAIGESTKNDILSGRIGEKGIGFKTVFAVASKVTISSGTFCFFLSEKYPTIPNEMPEYAHPTSGTKMTIKFRDKKDLPTLNTKTILDLCCCLRKLRKLEIGGHKLTIEDNSETRVITIDNKPHTFQRFIHEFTITDTVALEERRNGRSNISEHQRIVCYIPEKNDASEHVLYSGLPTKHKIRIPLIIDAPYALTTSREEIDTGSSAWNGVIRGEMYRAVFRALDALKITRRADILHFVNFRYERHGQKAVYANNTFDNDYLNWKDYNILEDFKNQKLLPTFDHNVFVAAQTQTAFRVPEIVSFLYNARGAGVISTSEVIDLSGKDKTHEPALNALGSAMLSFERAFAIIEKYAEDLIRDKEFRDMFYEYLRENMPHVNTDYKDRLKSMAIIPVYVDGKAATMFIAWQKGKIFVKRGSSVLGRNYYVLNENMLEKSVCENILGVDINEMTAELIRSRYNDDIKERILTNSAEALYRYLLNEFRDENLQRNDSLGTLLMVEDNIPLKSQLGEITTHKLFVCEKPEGYFPVDVIRGITINKECADLARYLKCGELEAIHYEDINYEEDLTEDDVESLNDDYFIHRMEILSGFYRDGLLDDSLLHANSLEYLAMVGSERNDEYYDFPSVPVNDAIKLKNHVKNLLHNPTRIVKVKVERTELKGQDQYGETFDLRIRDARDGALVNYTPHGAHGKCFCQMCKALKPYNYVKVNNIEVLPQYYFPQLRIALCLEHSKYFESLRNNQSIREEFLDAIRRAKITTQGQIDISIGDRSITFTGVHLAEIQEILIIKEESAEGKAVEIAHC